MSFTVQRAEVLFLSQPLEQSDVPCDGCSAPCCQHPDMRILISYEEAKRGLVFELNDVVLAATGKLFRDVAVLAKNASGKCVYFKDGRCSAWAIRPNVCRNYDCRQDPDPKMAEFAAERFK